MPLAYNDVQFLQELISGRSGNVVSTQQSYLFDIKLQPVAKQAGFQSVEELVSSIRESAPRDLCDQVAEAMTINETFFFRDLEPFNALRTTILPQLIRARSKRKSLRIWASACSTGQEAYSIAITIKEYFPELADWKISILGTDFAEEVLEKSSLGEYTQFEVNRGMPARLLVKYFDHIDGIWKAKQELRDMMAFQRLNLMEAWPPMPRIDIIFLRNVLIYFDVPTRETILRQMHTRLATDGSLILGGGESLMRLNVPFERAQHDRYVFFRPIQARVCP